MVGYNWKPMLSSSPMVDSSKAIAIPQGPKWLLTEWIREGCKKKTSLVMDNGIMEIILWGPDRPAKKWLWIFRRCIATQALQRRTLGSKFTRAQFAILSKPKWLYILNSANHFAKQPWLMCTHQIAFSTSFLFCQLSVFRLWRSGHSPILKHSPRIKKYTFYGCLS